MKIDELKLLAGVPYEIEGLGKIKPLTIEDIATIGQDKYNSSLSILCFDVGDVIKDMPAEEKEQVRAFDIIFMSYIQDPIFKQTFDEAIQLFLGQTIQPLLDQYSFQVEEGFVTRDNFEDLKLVIKEQNGISSKKKEDEYVAGNERARKFLEKMKKLKEKAPKQKGQELKDIVSSVAWKSGIGIKDVYNLTVYQLYDAFQRLNIVDNYDKTMNAVYSGNIETKSIDFKKINWSQSINFKNSD